MIAEQRSVHGDAGALRLKQLMQRGTDFLGTEYAILGGAMSWVSERNLVAAISNAGGFGVIACGAVYMALSSGPDVVRRTESAPPKRFFSTGA